MGTEDTEDTKEAELSAKKIKDLEEAKILAETEAKFPSTFPEDPAYRMRVDSAIAKKTGKSGLVMAIKNALAKEEKDPDS